MEVLDNNSRALLATTDEQQQLAARIQIELSEFIGAKLTEFRNSGGLPVAGVRVDTARNNGRPGVRLLVTL